MNLKQIPNYENYSLDLNNNEIYSHTKKKYIRPYLENKYYRIRLCKNSKIKKFMLHRLIYEQHLRLCTQSQNCMNRKTSKNNLSTGYKNITKTKWNTYQVTIWKKNKIIYQKNFKTLEEAILNRDIKLKEIHGEYANLG